MATTMVVTPISWDIISRTMMRYPLRPGILHLQMGDQGRITKQWGFDMLKPAELFHFKQRIFFGIYTVKEE